eukprot:6459791-Amphidinium_carterae.1
MGAPSTCSSNCLLLPACTKENRLEEKVPAIAKRCTTQCMHDTMCYFTTLFLKALGLEAQVRPPNKQNLSRCDSDILFTSKELQNAPTIPPKDSSHGYNYVTSDCPRWPTHTQNTAPNPKLSNKRYEP